MPPSLSAVLIADHAPRDRTAPTRQALRALLQTAGYRVKTVVDDGVGLACVAAGAIDRVLLRVGVVDPQDLAFCRRLRAQERGLHLPILMLVHPRTVEEQAGLLAMADDYMIYSTDPSGLLDRVELWMWIRRRLK